jgi:phosphate:Na+ symporter
MALANATRQTLLMASEVKTMLENFWTCFLTRNSALARELQVRDNEIDRMNNEIKSYLSRLNEESMGGKDSRMQLALLSFTSELEAIGDIIDRSLCHQVIKQDQQGDKLSREDLARLQEYYKMVNHRFEMAINVLATRSKGLAAEILSRKDLAKDLYLRHQKEHYAALSHNGSTCFNGSSYFLDILNSLRRISGHLTSIGYHFSGNSRASEQAAEPAVNTGP